MIGWIAQHTGLPSLLIDDPGVVYAGDRVLTVATGGMVVSDPFAPLGEPITYRHKGVSVTLTRPDLGAMMVTDFSGRTKACVHVLGDDGRDLDTGLTEIASDSGMVYPQWSVNLPPGRGTLQCRTSGIDTQLLLGLVKAQEPLIWLHSPAACQIPDCDIPPVTAMLVRSPRFARDGATTEARRRWQLPYTEATPAKSTSPLVTWGEYAGASGGVWTAESTGQVYRRIAGMPVFDLSWAEYAGASGGVWTNETLGAAAKRIWGAPYYEVTWAEYAASTGGVWDADSYEDLRHRLGGQP